VVLSGSSAAQQKAKEMIEELVADAGPRDGTKSLENLLTAPFASSHLLTVKTEIT